MENVVHSKLGEGRRIPVPAALCQRYGLKLGDPLVLEPAKDGFIVRSLESVVREVQTFCSSFASKHGGLLSEELIQERRAEAESEERA
jgi:bifunctional DNA-binding transcriptional regulator/antitoxin component of YhaV-PrlF toxin-antitoxin module